MTDFCCDKLEPFKLKDSIVQRHFFCMVVNNKIKFCLKLWQLEWQHLHGQPLKFVGPRVTWYRPTLLRTLLDIKKDNPNCHLIVGNTTIGKACSNINVLLLKVCRMKYKFDKYLQKF